MFNTNAPHKKTGQASTDNQGTLKNNNRHFDRNIGKYDKLT